MRMNKSVEKQVPAPDIQRRINAGWLRLWRTVWPNIPTPKVQSLEPAKSKVSGLESKVPTPMGGVQSLKSKVQSLEPAKSKVSRLESKVQRPTGGVQSLKSKVQSRADRRPAAVERLASFLAVWFALALLATGCAGTRPLKGGKAVTAHKPAGIIEQTLVQGENPSQASKQT